MEDLVEGARELEEGKEDYIQAILTDDGELINPMEKLRAVYPNTMLITEREKGKSAKIKLQQKVNIREKVS
ncbi:exonuclease SbcCD subunit D C-terminal domain-containing protein [Paraclostridium bifermentans]|uniref:Exonuclease SbcCD subunit D C-terminal domain-containing protein n=1 Tax=Paraclostridium bifermentans TaxID=1490 RepID=A0ABY8R6S5_PARBF|nr:exonuclease SbcCD subunit D C-terminal domain-containing protein [Paraclostridium bifermentans]